MERCGNLLLVQNAIVAGRGKVSFAAAKSPFGLKNKVVLILIKPVIFGMPPESA